MPKNRGKRKKPLLSLRDVWFGSYNSTSSVARSPIYSLGYGSQGYYDMDRPTVSRVVSLNLALDDGRMRSDIELLAGSFCGDVNELLSAAHLGKRLNINISVQK